MTESVSQLQAKLKALTHGKVDIMLDANTFKNTTQILREMSGAWKDMTDIERASALELMGGKRQANILSSIITNFQTVEDVIQSSSNAAGSAMAENEKYLDSIQGRIDLFTNSLQTMWMNALDSDIVKDIVDIGTAVIKMVDAFGLIPSAIGGFSAIKIASKSIKLNLDEVNKSIQKSIEAKKAQAEASKQNTEATNEETVAEEKGTVAKNAGSIAGLKDIAITELQTAKTKALAIAKGLLTGIVKSLAITLVSSLITKGIEAIWNWVDDLIHHAEKLKEEVNDLKTTYEDAKKTFDDNLTTLTTSSDTSVYATLEDEFRVLTKGVDQYGNNISLTSDQYERYKQICEQMVGIQPDIAKGYNSAAEAIGNNANALSELIYLQKQQARENAEQIISDENIGKFAEDSNNDYNNAQNKVANAEYERDSNLMDWAQWIIDPMDLFFDEIELSGETIDEELQTAYDNFVKRFYTDGVFDFSKVTDVEEFESYIREIDKLSKENNVQFFDPIWIDDLNTKDLANALDNIEAANAELEGLRDEALDIFYTVPEGKKAGPYYDKLNDASRKFITDLITNSPQFKVSNNKTGDQIKDNRDYLIKLIEDLANNDIKVNFNGKQITGQDFLDKYYNFDPSTVNWEEYQSKMQNFLNSLWEAIGADNNAYGIKYEDLEVHFGIDFVEDEKKIETAKQQIAGHIDMSADQIQDELNSMNAKQIKAFYSIDWNEADWGNIRSWDDVVNLINQQAQVTKDVTVKTYSGLSSIIEKFNEIQKQTEEIVLDNTEVTQEYKDSLTELGISEEDLADCFDESNGLIVKNASKLKQLVSATKSSISSQTTLARAQARLKYKELYEQIHSLTNGRKIYAKASATQINLLYQEMSAVQKMISRYSLLEQQLAEVTKTYTEFEEAQTVDSDNDYMSKTEEMLVAAIQAYETGELGTETAQVAIKALVPEIEFEGLNTVEEKAEKAHEYLTETLNKYFVLDFDDETGEIQSAEMKMGNLRKFVEEGFENNVFAGADWQHFEWSDEFLSGLEDAPDKLQYFADKMKVTKEVALAVIQEINNHDIEWLNGDYGSLFDQIVPETLDAKLQSTTAQMAALDVQLANGAIDQDTYTQKMGELTGKLEEQKSAALEACNSYMDLDSKISESKDKLEEYQKQLAQGTDENGNPLTQDDIDDINDAYQAELENYKSYLAQRKDLETKYGPMTEYTVSIALEEKGIDIENINDALVDTKKKINDTIGAFNETKEIIAEINDNGEIVYKITDDTSEETKYYLDYLGALNEDGTINIDLAYSALTPEQQAQVDELKDLSDKENLINYYLSLNGTDSVQSALDDLNDTLTKIYELLATSPVFKANVEPETKTVLDLLLDKVRSWVGEHVANFITKEKKEVTTEYKYITSPTSTTKSRQNIMGTYAADGTAHATGNWSLPSNEHNALVGELGPETVVDPRTGHYYTVGDNGAEFVDLPKGAIIFNHKQTEDLFKHGYVTSRGKMLASGTAYAEGNAHVTFYPKETVQSQWTGTGYSSWDDTTYDAADTLQSAANSISDSADSLSDATNDFEEVFDWVEVRLQEIDETLDLLDARLENAVTYVNKNSIIDQMISTNNSKLTNLSAGLEKYTQYAAKLLAEIPAKYQTAAQNGMIAITEFAGEADEATVEAIDNYREWAQKVADLRQQLEETKTTIRDLAIEQFDNAREYYDVRVTVEDSQTEKLQNAVDYDEERGLITSDAYYIAMMENSNKKIEYLTNARKAMQKELDDAVKAGQLVRGSNEWYELINQMYEIDASIDEATIELEEFQNTINDLYWDNFDELINRLDYLKNETQSLIDLMDNADMVTKPDGKTYEGGTVKYWTADDVQWTEEGIASLGLYAQQMEIAEYTARQYAEAIDDLEKDYKAGKYSENEYLEKLNELKDAQYENIEAYYDAQEAIKDLNQTRIDSIKDGISKEIDAYSELIEKKKQELDTEKDLYDFQKSTAEQQKNIADIQRKLASLSGDNSASAVAQRKKLEAELAEAKADLEESYYDRSVSDRSDALDKELEDFENEKNAEIEKWEEYLENIEQVVADSLMLVQDNALGVYNTLSEKAQEYDLTLSDAIMTPWQDGALAVSDYQTTFDTAMSSTMDQLENLKMKWQEVIDKMAEVGEQNVSNINKENATYAAATYTPPKKTTTTKTSSSSTKAKAITVGGKINAGNAKIYSYAGDKNGLKQYFSSDPIYTVLAEKNGYLKVRYHKLSRGATGWFKKSDVKAYAKGSKKIDEDQLAVLDELGDELVLHAGENGKLEYLTKGSGVVPADLTERLMDLAMNPQDMLDRNRPAITPSKSIVNNEINISVSYGDILHIEEFNGDDPDEIAKIVAKQLDKHTKDLNNAIRRYSR